MDNNPLPLVSIAIPLYHSSQFLAIILENIKVLPKEGVEILLSDRHGEDNALGLLRTALATDSRVRFLQADDKIGWVDHYNFLIEQAMGTYFMWMPHDDTFPAGYVHALVNDLENNPNAWLSFGDILTAHSSGQISRRMYLPERFQRGLSHGSVLTAVTLLCFWNLGIPFRGLIRRQSILNSGLLIKKAANQEFADTHWVFGLLLRSPAVYNSNQYCIKRYHPDNTHSRWKFANTFLHSSSARSVLKQYIWDAQLTNSSAFLVRMYLYWLIVLKRIYHTLFSESIRQVVIDRLTGHQKLISNTG